MSEDQIRTCRQLRSLTNQNTGKNRVGLLALWVRRTGRSPSQSITFDVLVEPERHHVMSWEWDFKILHFLRIATLNQTEVKFTTANKLYCTPFFFYTRALQLRITRGDLVIIDTEHYTRCFSFIIKIHIFYNWLPVNYECSTKGTHQTFTLLSYMTSNFLHS